MFLIAHFILNAILLVYCSPGIAKVNMCIVADCLVGSSILDNEISICTLINYSIDIFVNISKTRWPDYLQKFECPGSCFKGCERLFGIWRVQRIRPLLRISTVEASYRRPHWRGLEQHHFRRRHHLLWLLMRSGHVHRCHRQSRGQHSRAQTW